MKVDKLRSGVSLLESLIVIALIGIMAVFLTTSYIGVVRYSDLDSAAKVIEADLKLAQAKAMAGEENFNWGICFRNGGQQLYNTVTSDWPDYLNCPSDPDQTPDGVKQTSYLGGKLTFAEPQDGSSTMIEFQKITGNRVLITSGDVDIIVTDGTNTQTVTVSPSGKIYRQ